MSKDDKPDAWMPEATFPLYDPAAGFSAPRAYALRTKAEVASENKEKRRIRIENARRLGTHTPFEWAALVVACNGRCVRCRGASGLLNVEKDHIVGVRSGGCDCIHNLQPLCARCNAGKTNDFTDHRPKGWQHAVLGK